MTITHLDDNGTPCSVDPDAWFPDKPTTYTTATHIEHREHIAIVRNICNTCPVQTQCLTLALNNNERHGIWGGTTPEERATMHAAKETA